MLKRRNFLLLISSCLTVVLTLTFQQKNPNSSNTEIESVVKSESQFASATAAPAPQGLEMPPRGDVRIAVISDLNSQYGSTSYEPEVGRAIALIPDWQPDLVLCGGDMIAGQKRSLTQGQIEAMWTAFERNIAAPLRNAQIPFGFTIGNHDGSGASKQGQYTFELDRRLAAAYWKNPQHQSGLTFVDRARFPFYYSFQQDGIFYLVWDASTHSIPPEQLAWVERSLASETAQAAKMRVVIGHLPLYGIAVGRDKPGEFLADAEKLRSLLERYDVHTYISGHQHAYFPGKKGQLELLHAGALGSGPRQLLNSNLPPGKTLTIVDVDLNSTSTRYTTYDLKSLAVIDQETLPRIITAPNGKVLRRDVSELGLAEKVYKANFTSNSNHCSSAERPCFPSLMKTK